MHRKPYVTSRIIRGIEPVDFLHNKVSLQSMEDLKEITVPFFGTIPSKYIGRCVDILEYYEIDKDGKYISLVHELRDSDGVSMKFRSHKFPADILEVKWKDAS